MHGKIGEPVARLGVLGWTCIGQLSKTKAIREHTQFVNTYFVKSQCDINNIDESLRKFWEIEEVAMPKTEIMSRDNEKILQHTENTIKRSSDRKRYQVQIPWK